MSDSRCFVRDHSYLSGWIRYQLDGYSSFLVDLLHPEKNELILDDGSGNGRFSVSMSRKGANVILLDINKTILKSAMESLRRENLVGKAEAVHGDIQNLPFRGDVFDKVLCVHNLWVVPDYQSAVLEMIRTLREEGEVVIDQINILNRGSFVSRLMSLVSKILRRNYIPVFYRTPRTILRPFRELQFEVWHLVYSKGEPIVKKGESLTSPRLIVKCLKSKF